jgi:cytoskeletal protein RodZ
MAVERLRVATPATTSTPKRVKREEPTLGLDLGPNVSMSGVKTRSKAKAKTETKAKDALATPKSLTSGSKTATGQKDDGDDDEVQFISTRPVRRVVGR